MSTVNVRSIDALEELQASLSRYADQSQTALAAVPREVATKLSADIGRALASPDVVQRLKDAGAEAAPTTAEQFGQLLKAEIAKWGKVVKTAGITAD